MVAYKNILPLIHMNGKSIFIKIKRQFKLIKPLKRLKHLP
jgi:hypothetical protein